MRGCERDAAMHSLTWYAQFVTLWGNLFTTRLLVAMLSRVVIRLMSIVSLSSLPGASGSIVTTALMMLWAVMSAYDG